MQLCIQLQTEELMRTSLKESFQETSESDWQAIVSAEELAISLQNEMSQATTACDSLKTKVIRLIKEVVEQSAKRTEEGASVHLPPSGLDCSQPFTPTEKVDSPFQPLRPAEGNPWKHIHFSSTSTALSDTRSVTNKNTSKRKEAKKFEFEPWPQGSKFSSWNVPFRREVTTRSTHPRLINEFSTEVGLAAATQECDC